MFKLFTVVFIMCSFGAFAHANEDISTALFNIMKKGNSVGDASSGCRFQLQKGPPSFDEESGVFEFAAISVQLSEPVQVENKLRKSEIQFLVVGEPLITRTSASNNETQITASFDVIETDGDADKLMIVTDEQLKVTGISAQSESAELFNCR